METRLGFKDIANFFLEWFFAPVYVLTVTPFTVQFFRRFVTSPQVDVNFFGLASVSLAQVHEAFLPIFVLTLEIISVQVATGWWRNYFRRRWETILALSFVLVLLQAFPYFSTYYDARIYELDQIQNVDREREAERRQREENDRRQAQNQAAQAEFIRQQQVVDAEYTRQLQAVQGEYTRQLDEYNRRKESMENQIGQLQTNIIATNQQIDSLLQRTSRPGTLAERNQAEAQLAQARLLIDDYRAQFSSAQDTLQQLLRTPPGPLSTPPPPARPAAPTPLPPVTIQSPALTERKTDAEFVLETMWEPKSILAFGVALIFPFIVFGAGYVLAQNRSSDSNEWDVGQSPVHLDLSRELRECSRLPVPQQVGYARALEAIITAYAIAIRTTRTLSLTHTEVTLKNEREMQILESLLSLKDRLPRSHISASAQEILVNHIDDLIKTQTFTTGG